jgi:hypothetical protein
MLAEVRDFSADLAQSREISYAEWKARSFIERGPEFPGWILERQQQFEWQPTTFTSAGDSTGA